MRWPTTAPITHTVASLNNGLDFEPWPGVVYGPVPVTAALTAGQVSQATIDEHLQRILRTLFAFGFFDRAAYQNDDSQIDKPAHAAVAQRIEESAVTLLKNQGALPLDAGKLSSIAVIGPDANRFVTGNGSGSVTPFSSTTPLAGIRARVGPNVAVHYDDGSNTSQAQADAKGSQVAVVFVGDYETEGADRPCMGLNCSNAQEGGQYATLDKDALIRSVLAANPNTIVVLETGAPVLTPWRDQVRGLVEAWYPGEQGGTAIARTLFGDVNPAGRLPATFPQQEADTPTAGDPAKYPGLDEQVFYKEGLSVGYRWYDVNNLKPAYPFGFGLSYTSFRYAALAISKANATGDQTASLQVTNTGSRTGDEVPQVYLGPVPGSSIFEPPKRLAGFDRLTLKPGQSERISVPIRLRSKQYWDVGSNGWQNLPGCIPVLVGASSRDIRLQGNLCATSAAPPLCAARQRAGLSLRQPRGARITRVVAFVGGRRVARTSGRRLTRIVVPTHGRTSFTVKLVETTSGRRTITALVRYRACARQSAAPHHHRHRARGGHSPRFTG